MQVQGRGQGQTQVQTQTETQVQDMLPLTDEVHHVIRLYVHQLIYGHEVEGIVLDVSCIQTWFDFTVLVECQLVVILNRCVLLVCHYLQLALREGVHLRAEQMEGESRRGGWKRWALR